MTKQEIIDASPAAGALGLLRHRMEGEYFRALKGKTFFLKGKIYTNVPGSWSIALSNGAETAIWLDQVDVPIANVWTDFILDVTHNPAIGSWNYDTSAGLVVAVPLVAGSSNQTTSAGKRTWSNNKWVVTGSANQNFHSSLSNIFYLSQLQIVTNPDEEFQSMGGSYAEEGRLIQRYFEKSYDIDVAPNTNTVQGATCWGGQGANLRPPNTVYFRNLKRIVPAVTAINPNGSNANIRDVESALEYSANFNMISTGNFMVIPGSGTPPNGTILRMHWTADAEF